MSVKTLIDQIAPFAPAGYSRIGANSIAKIIEQGQDELFDFDAPYMQWRGMGAQANSGMPPYLTTVAGTMKYEITAANLTGITTITWPLGGTARTVRCRKVLKVFIDSTKADYGRRWFGQPYLFSWQNPYSTEYTKLEVIDYPVNSFPALENDVAWVEFLEDPGASTSTYFVLFVWEPPRIDAETTPLCVPSRYEAALEDYAIGVIQTRASGRVSERLRYFREYWVPQFQQLVANSIANPQESTVTLREC